MTYKIKNIRVIWTEMGKIVENLKSGLKLRKIKKYTDMKMEKMEKSGNQEKLDKSGNQEKREKIGESRKECRKIIIIKKSVKNQEIGKNEEKKIEGKIDQ